jgi:hypothetical protein
MHRKIYLLRYPAPPGQRRHFAIWVPSNEDHKIGRIIRVLGTPFMGFNLGIQHGHNTSEAWPMPAKIELGVVACEVVVDTRSGQLPETTAGDKLESMARSVTPPGPSRNLLIVDGVSSITACTKFVGEYVLTSSHTEREQKMPRMDRRVHRPSRSGWCYRFKC